MHSHDVEVSSGRHGVRRFGRPGRGAASALAAALGFCLIAGEARAQLDHDMAFARELGIELDLRLPLGQQVALAELDGMRGGFITVGGVDVRFGFDIVTNVSGQIVQRFTLPRGTDRMTMQAMGPDGTLETSVVPVARGPGMEAPRLPNVETVVANGNTRIDTSFDAGLSTVIANTMNGVDIRRTAIFDVDLIGMRGRLGASSAHEALLTALAASRNLRR
jgi:hypothetical protein